MTSVAIPPFSSLMRRALSLGSANALDYVMQFLLPVVLVRCLSPEAFGTYRMLWLAVMTIMVVVPLSMPQCLYFFLPRADAPTRRAHVLVTLLYLAVAGSIGGLLIGPWNPWLPASMKSLAVYGPLVPVIAVLFAVTMLLDVLPTIEERVQWQVGVIVFLSLLRTGVLGATAYFTGRLEPVLWALLALMLLKLALLLGYIARNYGLGRGWWHPRAFSTQFRHASPLGLSAALYGLRPQADQWVAASLFALDCFAAFSIAAVLSPMMNLFRQSVNHVFMPSMSRLHANGDLEGMVGLNSRANMLVATLAFPMLALAFAFAQDLITLVYTGVYADGAPVMRVYIAGLVPFVVEVSGLMLLLRQGPFALRLNSGLLLVSLGGSAGGALVFGLAGAAAGSTLAIYLDRLVTLRRISSRTGIPFARLQNWSGLLRLASYAGFAALVARGLVGLIGDHHPVVRLAYGSLALGLTYGALWLRQRSRDNHAAA
ncbi:MAG TPA: lipopolysaccharide biosynthesis protein [Azospira sp.]|nr:lipopolysaccharide biosynthesis protein [Azospira sp.]